MTISKKLIATFGVLVITNFVVGALLWQATQRVDAANAQALWASRLMKEIGELSAAFETEQGTIRGYVISSRPELLYAGKLAAAEVDKALLQSRKTATSNDILSLIDRAEKYVGDWRTEVRDLQLELMRHPLTVDEARLFETTGQNDDMIGYVRQTLSQAAGLVQRSAAEKAELVEAAVQRMRIVTGAGMLAMIALGLFLGLNANRAVSRPIKALTAQMGRLAGGDTDVEIGGTHRRDEIGAMARTVEVFRENAIQRARLEDEAQSEQERDRRRRRRIEELIAAFREEVRTMLAAVGVNMGQMSDTAKILAGIAEQTAGRAANVSSASEEASANVQTVATAAEELSMSINEISRQVNDTTRFVAEATDGTRDTNEKVAGLAAMAQRIGDVVSLIQDVAEQTNLLALNATIEAARAGERGKGFAVVAAEVKTLAGQTARATEEIAQQIAAIQSSTGGAVEAIKTIARRMEEVNSYSSAIAAAVEQQGAATDEISRNVREAATGTRSVVENVAGLTSAAGETSRSASQVEQVSRDAVEQAERLRGVVDRFLEQVAAA